MTWDEVPLLRSGWASLNRFENPCTLKPAWFSQINKFNTESELKSGCKKELKQLKFEPNLKIKSTKDQIPKTKEDLKNKESKKIKLKNKAKRRFTFCSEILGQYPPSEKGRKTLLNNSQSYSSASPLRILRQLARQLLACFCHNFYKNSKPLVFSFKRRCMFILILSVDSARLTGATTSSHEKVTRFSEG